MRRPELLPIAIGGLLLTLGALFPPRVTSELESELGGGTRVGRASLTHSDFYVQYVGNDGEVLSSPAGKEVAEYVDLRLDWDLLLTQSIGIVGLAIFGFSVMVMARRGKTSEQAVPPKSDRAGG